MENAFSEQLDSARSQQNSLILKQYRGYPRFLRSKGKDRKEILEKIVLENPKDDQAVFKTEDPSHKFPCKAYNLN